MYLKEHWNKLVILNKMSFNDNYAQPDTKRNA